MKGHGQKIENKQVKVKCSKERAERMEGREGEEMVATKVMDLLFILPTLQGCGSLYY